MRPTPCTRISPKLTDCPVRSLNVPLGLLFNFHEVKLVDGISRLILPRCKQALNRRKRRQRRARAEPKAAARQGTEKSGSSRGRPAAFAPGADYLKRLKRYEIVKVIFRPALPVPSGNENM